MRRDVIWIDTCHQHRVRTTTTTTTTTITITTTTTTTTTTTHKVQTGVAFSFCVALTRTLAVAPCRANALLLRSWAKHERLTVATALAENPPPQSPNGGGRQARRPTCTDDCQSHWCAAGSPEGSRAAGWGSHGRLRGCPVAVPLLSDAGGHCGRDSGRPHGQIPPQGRTEKEGGGGGEGAGEEGRAAAACHRSFGEGSRGSRRKRKKKRKRRLPRSSVPRGGRARRRQRRWLVPGWFSWWFLGIYGIMVGLDQKDSYAASSACASRSFLWLQAQMLGIMAGMFQKDCCAFGWFCWGRCTSRCFLFLSSWPVWIRRTVMRCVFIVVNIPIGVQKAFSRGPGCSPDHRDSPVAPVHGGRCPWYAGRGGRYGPVYGPDC